MREAFEVLEDWQKDSILAISQRFTENLAKYARRRAELTGDDFREYGPLMRVALTEYYTTMTLSLAFRGRIGKYSFTDFVDGATIAELVNKTDQQGSPVLKNFLGALMNITQTTTEREMLILLSSALEMEKEGVASAKDIFTSEEFYTEAARRSEAPADYIRRAYETCTLLKVELIEQLITDLVSPFEAQTEQDRTDLSEIKTMLIAIMEAEIWKERACQMVYALEEANRIWGSDAVAVSVPESILGSIQGIRDDLSRLREHRQNSSKK